MDPLADFLDGPRARGAFLLRVLMSPPWSMAVRDEAPLTLVQQVTGSSWVWPEEDGGPPAVRLDPGHVLVARGPARYVVASTPGLEPSIVIGPGQDCRGEHGRELARELRSGVRTWGNNAQGPDTVLVGTYQSTGEVGAPLLGVLPALLVVPRDPAPEVSGLLRHELTVERAGQAGVLDRLLDVLLVHTLRAWADDQAAPHLLAGGQDPLVRDALWLMRERPADPWTVEMLAAAVGVSRSALSRRFTAALGVPPMTYLSRWRLATAADLLHDTDHTLETVARRVGYANPFSLSTAFKREYGRSPQQWRAAPHEPDFSRSGA